MNGLEPPSRTSPDRAQPTLGFSNASAKSLVNTDVSALTKDPHGLRHFRLVVWSRSQIKPISNYFHFIPELKVENYIVDNIAYSLFHHIISSKLADNLIAINEQPGRHFGAVIV
jgi:hypothetical protein